MSGRWISTNSHEIVDTASGRRPAADGHLTSNDGSSWWVSVLQAGHPHTHGSPAYRSSDKLNHADAHWTQTADCLLGRGESCIRWRLDVQGQRRRRHNYREPPTIHGRHRQTDSQDASGCQRLVPLGPMPPGIRNVTHGNSWVHSRAASLSMHYKQFDSVSIKARVSFFFRMSARTLQSFISMCSEALFNTSLLTDCISTALNRRELSKKTETSLNSFFLLSKTKPSIKIWKDS